MWHNFSGLGHAIVIHTAHIFLQLYLYKFAIFERRHSIVTGFVIKDLVVTGHFTESKGEVSFPKSFVDHFRNSYGRTYIKFRVKFFLHNRSTVHCNLTPDITIAKNLLHDLLFLIVFRLQWIVNSHFSKIICRQSLTTYYLALCYSHIVSSYRVHSLFYCKRSTVKHGIVTIMTTPSGPTLLLLSLRQCRVNSKTSKQDW